MILKLTSFHSTDFWDPVILLKFAILPHVLTLLSLRVGQKLVSIDICSSSVAYPMIEGVYKKFPSSEII